MNEALISDDLDFASGGVGSSVTIWACTKNNPKGEGVCAWPQERRPAAVARRLGAENRFEIGSRRRIA